MKVRLEYLLEQFSFKWYILKEFANLNVYKPLKVLDNVNIMM